VTAADLRALMSERGYSVRGLARALEAATLRPVWPSTVQRWRKGTHPIPDWVPAVLERLTEELCWRD
jgi:hypothetical protein